MLTAMPTALEVHAMVKSMDGFSAPGPDGLVVASFNLVRKWLKST